ncbi:unannotated protein [freshwater metagenome]|uniref:Unannotated protein n=1 Tax=freshwater metagenome TaxID=449393 RepID=A0A6J7D1Y5_9ZZZZ
MLLLSGCATTESAPSPVASNDLSKLTWKTCYSEFQCATLKVPIDYADLSIGTFDIAVLRYRNPNQHDRIGSLVINPGGPGVSGIEYAIDAEFILNPEILERFDIVGFDPRGVGQSSAIQCLTDSEQDAAFATDPKPDNDSEYAQAITDTQNYVDKCIANTKNLKHFSTAESARDMELLRQSLGDAQLNFMGFSYGTYLGTLYAQQYPDKVGRFVLDGAINPSISVEQQTLIQVEAFDTALANFISDCLRRKDCSLPKNATGSFFTQLFDSVAAKPLVITEGGSTRLITEGLVVTGTAAALYDDVTGWPLLQTAIAQALEGDGTGFAQLADGYYGRTSDGTYLDNQNDANMIIDCLDWPSSSTNEEIRAAATKFVKTAPVFGPYVAYSEITCNLLNQTIGKKVNQSNQNSAQIKLNKPILIIGTTQDPATPYAWAKALSSYILGSRLVTLKGEGHTGYGRGSACTDDAVDTYLTTGQVPAQNITCSQ